MRGLLSIARPVLDAVLPPTCARCRAVVERNGTVCAECWRTLRFLAPPWCECCGFPFEFEAERPQPAPGIAPGTTHEAAAGEGIGGSLCAGCLHRPRRFRRARAALGYDDASRALILAFKHADRTETTVTLATWMAQAGRELLETADLIVPVPLHWRRLFLRRYNQSALLARQLAETSGKPFQVRVLERRRATRSQGHLGAEARRRNVAGAFRIRESLRPEIVGRRVLLVDDVYTTGATVSACVACLRAGGAAEVDVLVLARVLRS